MERQSSGQVVGLEAKDPHGVLAILALTASPIPSPLPFLPVSQWMVLHLAVTNNWGGGDSYRKATLLLEETLRLFVPPPLARTAHRPKQLPTPEELEEKLGDYMEEVRGRVGTVA